jgi:hypothetical protein
LLMIHAPISTGQTCQPYASRPEATVGIQCRGTLCHPACCACREEELRILRGEQDVGSSRINSGRRGTAGAAAGGGSDSGSSSDGEGDTGGGGWNGGARGAGRPGQWGGNMQQQQQQQQQVGGVKVSGVLLLTWLQGHVIRCRSTAQC